MLPFFALVKSNAAIFMSPTTRRFAKLLSDALFLVRAVRVYGSVGIDVGGIAIWDEANKENDAEFRKRNLRTSLPPPPPSCSYGSCRWWARKGADEMRKRCRGPESDRGS